MKKKNNLKSIVSLLFILFFSVSFGQVTGDYRSVGTGNWNTLATWQYYNGSTWVTPSGTSPQGYPGQFTGTNEVTIQAGNSVTFTNTITTVAFVKLTINGTLILSGTGTGPIYDIRVSTIVVTPSLSPLATINFVTKGTLALPSNAVLQVSTGGLSGDCNNNQQISIGTFAFAFCAGGGSSNVTFLDLTTSGGTLNAIATSNSPVCSNGTINLTGAITGLPGVGLTYTWTITTPSGSTSTVTSQNTTISSPSVGTYTVKLTCNTTYNSNSFSNEKTILVVVNPNKTAGAASSTPTLCINTALTNITRTTTGATGIGTATGLPTGVTAAYASNTITISGTPTASGTFNYSIPLTGGCGSVNATGTITVRAASTAAVISGTASICSGSSTNLQIAITGGSSPFTVVYTTGSASGYISGSNISVAPSSTTPYTVTAVTDANGCLGTGNSGSAVVTIGSTTSTNGGISWSNGAPTSTKAVVFDGSTGTINADLTVCSLRLINSATVTVASGFNVTLAGAITVDSGNTFTLNNSASLIQTNDAAINTGSIKMIRTTRAMPRWAYVYGGSPVAENAFSQLPSQFDLKYRWTSGTMNGAWAGLTSLTSGEGFIARVRNIAPFSTGTGTIDFVYTGTPKNGVVNVTVDSYDSSSLVAGNTVLLSNPYPSAISGSSFLTHSNNTELGGTLFFWTSVTLYSGSGNYSTADYGSWNLSGGVATSPSSDPTNIGLKPNGNIAAGQGFFAQAFADGPISFNNSMRIPSSNSQFFKASNATQSDDKNRIWLNLYSDTTFRQTLVGYINGATNGFDKFYDADTFTNNEINIYSLLGNKKLVIQAKALPFDENDIVPLGYKITNGGVYSINTDELDGIFAGNQTVYLRDKLLAIDHDIKASPYTFSTTAGTFDNRFELVYVATALGTNNPNTINTFAMISNNTIKVQSSELMKEINVYDITGKLITKDTLPDLKTQFSTAFNYPNGVYIAKITFDNGMTVSKKLIK